MASICKPKFGFFKKRGLWAVAFLLTLVAGLFLPWWLAGRVLAPFDILQQLLAPWNEGKFQSLPQVHNHYVTDAVTQYIPYALFAKASYLSDGFVGWNPFLFGGVAHHANTMALCYDWSSQLYRMLEFWPAWHLARMGQFLIAGLGMLVFLRSRGCSVSVSLLGATGYLINTQFVVWIYHHWALASFCWAPWLLWSLHRGQAGSNAHLGLSAVFLALSLMGGTLQHAAFLLLLLLSLWMGWMWEGNQAGVSKARSSLVILLTGVLGACLAAPMLEVTIHAYFENLRAGQIRGVPGYPEGIAQPFWNFPSIFFYAAPSLLGSPPSLDLWKLFKSDAFNVASFGTVPVILAWLGLFGGRIPPAARFLVGAGLLLPLTPLVGALYHRVQLLWILGGCWVAAAWLQNANQGELKSLARWLGIGFFSLGVVWLAGSFGLLALRPRLEPFLQIEIERQASASQFGLFSLWMRQRVGLLFSALPIWNLTQILTLVGIGLSIWGLPSLHSRHSGWLWIIPSAGVAIQGLVFWHQWTTWSTDTQSAYGKPHWVKILQKEVGISGRLAQDHGSYAQVPFGPNTLQPSGVSVALGYESIVPHGLSRSQSEPWKIAGVTHYFGKIAGPGPVGWPVIHSDNGWHLLKKPDQAKGESICRNGQISEMPAQNILRLSFNTMRVSVPQGTEEMEIFENWHQGWKWKFSDQKSWRQTQKGARGGIAVAFGRPLVVPTKIDLTYDPRPSSRALWLLGFGGMGVVGVIVAWRRQVD